MTSALIRHRGDRSAQLGGHVHADVRAVADDLAPADHDARATSAAVAANTAASSAVSAASRRAAPRRARSSPDRRCPDFDRARLGPADRARGRRGSPPQQRGRAMAAALAAGQALVQLHRARLLEQVDDRVRVGAERERAPASAARRAGPIPSARSRSVVGQKQQQARRRRAAAMSASSRWVACTAVNRSRQRARLARAARSACARRRRRTPRSRPAARRRARAEGSRARSPRRRRPPPIGVHAADAVDRGADPSAGTVGERPTRCAQASTSASAKRRWTSSTGSPIPPCR